MDNISRFILVNQFHFWVKSSLPSLSPYLLEFAVALAHAALVAVLVLLAGERGRVRAGLLLAPERSHAPLPALADSYSDTITFESKFVY